MKPTNSLNWPGLFLLIAILFGSLVRFMPALVTRFPINDGGMFLDMTRDLQANNHLLPATTTYNELDLPYAYPPLGFYLTSLLSTLGRIPLIDLFLWLPAFLAALTIPAFYLVSRALLADDLRASLATIFFALTPGRYDWHIMGGGITRALGMIFLLLAAYSVLRLFQQSRSNLLFPAILFCSLAVLSHPEVGLQTAGLCAVFWLFHGRTWRGSLLAASVTLGVVLLTAPWWGTVLAQHGPAPFLSALQTGQHTQVNWLAAFVEVFPNGEFLPLLLILRLFGFFYALWKRQFLLIVLIIVPVMLDPRSAASISFLSLSMLSALALLDALPALLGKMRKTEPVENILEHRAGVTGIFALTMILFIECGLHNYIPINTTLTPAEREAMTWVQTNLPPDSDFLLITSKPYSMSDPLQEWFPTLTGQHSQTTLQGLEWTLGPAFNTRLDELVRLQACADIACVQTWSERTSLTYDYIWFTSISDTNTIVLMDSLRSSAGYETVYDSGSIVIFSPTIK